MPDRLSEYLPGRMRDGMPENMFDRMPDRQPGNILDRMSENVSNRTPDRRSDKSQIQNANVFAR